MEYLPILIPAFIWMIWITVELNKQWDINKTNQHLYMRVLEHLSNPHPKNKGELINMIKNYQRDRKNIH
jgi:hypothetical protein